MKIKHRPSNLFIRYLLCYLIVLVIPITILSVVSTSYIKDILQRDAINSEYNTLTRFKEAADSDLNEIRQIAFKISSHKDFTPYIVNDYYSNALTILNNLKNYKIANSFLSDLILITTQCEYIYSPDTTYTFGRLIKQKFGGKFTEEEFKNILFSINAPTFDHKLQNLEGEDYYYIMPLPTYDIYPYGYLLFQISRDTLSTLADNHAQQPNRNNLIIFKGTVIASGCDYPEDLTQQVLEKVTGGNDGASAGRTDVVYKGEDYFCFSMKSDYLGWTYVRVVPAAETTGKINQVLMNFSRTVVLILILGSAIIYFLTYVNYSPIKKLTLFAQERLGIASDKSKNEIKTLKALVDEACLSIVQLNQDISETQPALRYFFIKNLIKGNYYDRSSMDAIRHQTGIDFYESNYFVAIFRIHKNNADIKNHIITEFINESIAGYFKGYAAESIYEDNIIAVFTSETSNAGLIKNTMNSLRRLVGDRFNVSLTVGMGGIKEDINSISNSFLEASTALDHRLIMGKNNVISFYELDSDSYSKINYPHVLLNMLCSDIKNGQTKAVLSDIDKLISFIRQNAHSMHIARLLSYDITNNILKTMHEIYSDYESLSCKAPDMISLIQFETIEDLENMLAQFCEDVCNYISDVKNVSMSEMVINYIKRNYSSVEFSVNTMADSLGVSAAHLSRTFKEQSGITITEYIKQFKIELAKKMLVETDKHIDKIISMLGYCDSSSFIRKFKKTTGVTPGEYRKINRSY